MNLHIQQQIAQLNQRAEQLYQEGRYTQAVQLVIEALNLIRQYLGEDHPDFGICLNSLALLYYQKGNYAKAESLYRRAIEIMRKTLGEDHLEIAPVLSNLAGLYQALGDYNGAETLLHQAMEIMRNAHGEDHIELATILNSLGRLYGEIGNYVDAELFLQQALNSVRTALGEEHPYFAISLNNLAQLYLDMSDYATAEPLYKQSLDILRTTMGEEHPEFATFLSNLAVLYRNTGEYTKAEALYQQVLEIRRRLLGEAHPDVALSLNNLAVLYEFIGNFAAAQSLYQQALQIWLTAFGEEHGGVATTLDNLARLYHHIGDHTTAEALYQQALGIRRRLLGEAHPEVARSLNNLATFHQYMGEDTTAEPLYQQALEIWRNTLGARDPNVARCMGNLAQVYHNMGNYAGAESLYQQALEIMRAAFGAEHLDVATALNNLGVLYLDMGNYMAAEPLLRDALEIFRTKVEDTHPEIVGIHNNLVILSIATSRQAEALTLNERAAALDDRRINHIFSIGSERQRLAYLQHIEGNFYGFLSLIFQHFPQASSAVHEALDLVLRRKAVGAEALAAQRDAVLGGRYPELEPQLRKLTTLRAQIAQKTLAGPGPEGLETHEQLLMDWHVQKERLEAELARHIPEVNLEQQLRAANRRAVASALPEGTALVEFVRLNVFDFLAVPAQGQSRLKPPRYLAFVLPAGDPENVQMIDLGEAEHIDQQIATFRVFITGDEEARSRRNLETMPNESFATGSNEIGTTLREAVFDPLIDAIRNCRGLLLAPDGDLNRLPFEALPTNDGRYLIDTYHISYLGTGRDVLRFGAEVTGQPTDALVIADPDFDLTQSVDQSVTNIEHGRQSHDVSRQTLHFGHLPGTRVEGERIAAMLNVQPWLGENALETRLRASQSPCILHLATHGFFLADQKHNPNEEGRNLGAIGWAADGMERLSGPGLENPLLRSGLALAGANTWLKGGTPPTEAEDGILTAEDVSGLDLLSTELVVLSACETGLGQVHIGEGVFGLRRAFMLAGAKTLVMSLWKVPDRQTQELMIDFCRRILVGQPRADALREAQLAIKAKYPEPLYWGAFICQGDPNPLP